MSAINKKIKCKKKILNIKRKRKKLQLNEYFKWLGPLFQPYSRPNYEEIIGAFFGKPIKWAEPRRASPRPLCVVGL